MGGNELLEQFLAENEIHNESNTLMAYESYPVFSEDDKQPTMTVTKCSFDPIVQ